MEKIITIIGQEFIKNIVEIIATEGTFANLEQEMLAEVKKCAAKMLEVYAESVEAAITMDKTGRRKAGYVIERRGDERRLHTLVGEVVYQRNYYKKAAGGYEYLTDTALGIEKRERVSGGLSLALVKAARDMSYGKASAYITGNEISRQTVMGKIRRSSTGKEKLDQQRSVPELHIDADEAHITLQGGKKSEVPLISIYEGIEKQGKRRQCKNIFHISEYGKTPDEIWEQALTEIERRYDITGTKIYLHGDGGSWIQTGLEWITPAKFVLDKYHKNKAIKTMTAGMPVKSRKFYDREMRDSLAREDLLYFEKLSQSLKDQLPDREDKIQSNEGYLKRFVSGISICEKDSGANNGGSAEPHVSHILSSRLSSRPMAWSKRTLKQLAPLLTTEIIVYRAAQEPTELPKPLQKAVANANKSFRKQTFGLPHPDAIGTLPLNGKITGTQVLLKRFV